MELETILILVVVIVYALYVISCITTCSVLCTRTRCMTKNTHRYSLLSMLDDTKETEDDQFINEDIITYIDDVLRGIEGDAAISHRFNLIEILHNVAEGSKITKVDYDIMNRMYQHEVYRHICDKYRSVSPNLTSDYCFYVTKV